MSNQSVGPPQVAPMGTQQPHAASHVPVQHPPANLAHFFSTLTPNQLAMVDPMGLLSGLMPLSSVPSPAAVSHQLASINTLFALGQAASSANAITTSVPSIQAPSAPVNGPSPRRQGKSRKSTNGSSLNADGTRKATRPLNSWIAFRCYYSTIFTAVQQKEISGFVKCLWQGDLFKAKWTLLAKAYSVIRDFKGKIAAPLDQFLTMNAPFIGIIAPSDYLGILGWEIQIDETHTRHMNRRFTPALSSLDERYILTEHSVHDILHNCEEKGYLCSGELPRLQHNIIAARPSIRNRGRNVRPVQNSQTNDNLGSSAPQTTNESIASHSSLGLASVQSGSIGTPQADVQDLVATPQSTFTADTLPTQSTDSTNETQGQLLSDIDEGSRVKEVRSPPPGHNLEKDLKASGSSYPHLDLFGDNPLTSLKFDPFDGDLFDPYNLQSMMDDEEFANPDTWDF